MELAFFYPLAWLGAAAVAVPIWLHLHRRRETNLVLFSALRFLDDQPIARRRPLWPRDLPLLLLRIAGLLLIIAAFAWPYLPADAPQQLVTESVVYILDNTLSHQANGAFETARDELAQQLEASPPGRQNAVIELSSIPRVLADFSDEPQAAATRVRERQPSFARGSYLAAFRQADELLGQSLGQRQRIVLLTDHQANQWHEGRQSPPFLQDVEVQYDKTNSDTLANLAIWQPRAQRIASGDSHLVQCNLRLFHQGPAASATIQLVTNGEPIGTREIQISGEPQIMSIGFDWPTDERGWIRGELRINGQPDELLGDNTAWFSVPPERPGVVGVLSQSTFLRTALAPDVMQGRWIAELLDAEKLEPTPSQMDVLVVELSLLHRKRTQDYVWRHLQQGRGLIVTVDELTSSGVAFLRQLGATTKPRVQMTANDNARIRYFYAQHSLLKPFESGELGNLLEVEIQGYYPLESERGVPLIFGSNGEPIVMQVPAKGPVLLFGFALDRRDTNWPLHVSFIPFLDLCLKHARPSPPDLASMSTGEACTWQVSLAQEVDEIVLFREGKKILSAPVHSGQAKFVLPPTPGLYELHYDAATDPAAMLEVNPAPAESELAYTDPGETLESWKLPGPMETSNRQGRIDKGPLSEAAILRQQVWWWLLLVGVSMLVVETAWLALREERV